MLKGEFGATSELPRTFFGLLQIPPHHPILPIVRLKNGVRCVVAEL